EIFRGGIQAVDKGQVEAARSLGLGYFRTLYKVVLPQAIKIMIPPIINQFITTLKDTSILSVISVRELTMNSQIIIAKNYMPFEVYSFAAGIYLVVIIALSLFAKWVERRLQYDH
ncbi:MAG: amino acid ABC transporter permease, partial [Selenomonadaceae bacterium]